jgi:hypothetical protein
LTTEYDFGLIIDEAIRGASAIVDSFEAAGILIDIWSTLNRDTILVTGNQDKKSPKQEIQFKFYPKQHKLIRKM